jgi:hypothetical protein
MGQHNSFGKDIEMISEAYGAMLNGAHMMAGTGPGIAAQQAADHMAGEEDEEVKVGDDVMWDRQRKRGIVDKIDIESGIADITDHEGNPHHVDLKLVDPV